MDITNARLQLVVEIDVPLTAAFIDTMESDLQKEVAFERPLVDCSAVPQGGQESTSLAEQRELALAKSETARAATAQATFQYKNNARGGWTL